MKLTQPTMPGVHTRARYAFTNTRPTKFVAVYGDGTSGPERDTREEAEQDYQAVAQGLTHAD